VNAYRLAWWPALVPVQATKVHVGEEIQLHTLTLVLDKRK